MQVETLKMYVPMDYFFISIKLVGTLCLLIFGMKMLSESLQSMTGNHLKKILARMAGNRFTGMITGMIVTASVQSSTATTVMTVSFVSAGMLTLFQAISVIMGANIGTTLSAWIMTLGYSIDLSIVVYLCFLVGIFLVYMKRYRHVGTFLFGVAFMFMALVTLSKTGREMDLEDNAAVIEFFSSFDVKNHLTIFIFFAIGSFVTCMIHSSAALIAITIMLCSSGVLPIYLGLALVLGENLGSTATANIVALGANTDARRAAMAHLVFNVFGVIWVSATFYPFVDMVCSIVGYDNTMSGQTEKLPVVIAMFHTTFNVLNTAILIGFVKQIEAIVCKIIPERHDAEAEFTLRYIQSSIVQTPEVSVLQAKNETAYFADCMREMFDKVKEMMGAKDEKILTDFAERLAKEEELADKREMAIAEFLANTSDEQLSDDSRRRIRIMMREVSELESIGDSCYKLSLKMVERHTKSVTFTQSQEEGLQAMTTLASQSLQTMCLMLRGPRDRYNLDDIYAIENDINSLRDSLHEKTIMEINDHQCSYLVGTLYMDMICEMERLCDSVVNIAEARYSHKKSKPHF